MKFIRLLTYVLLFSSLQMIGQMEKGEKYFKQNRFIRAVPYFKKAAKNDKTKHEAFSKLGFCYLQLNQYDNAELAYKNALAAATNPEPILHYNYASVLKVNGKYEEALSEYNLYLKAKPNDEDIKKVRKFCAEIKYWMSKPQEYEVRNAEEVNTIYSEFCPVYYNSQLIFSAERNSFDFVEYTKNEFSGTPYLNMFKSEIKDSKLRKEKPLSKRLNTESHDGPVTITGDGKTIYFTRVAIKNKRNFTNTAKIYFSESDDKHWKKCKAFKYNSNDYSVGHPAISKDGILIVFSSDMPGGYGGKDLWYCKKQGDDWSKPINLGPDINTSGNELFPSIRDNGTLYFSSTGLPGFGGLDIYSAKQVDGKWLLIRNEGMNLNSSHDDFGITFVNDSIGYFSSNRNGGKGADDIYEFKYTDKSVTISGKVLLTENINDPAKGVKVSLKDVEGNDVASTKTDNNGVFTFKNLESEKEYMAVIDSDDPQFKGKARYYLTDNNNVIHRVSNKSGSDKFVFKKLPIDPNGLPDMYTDDNLTLAGNLLYGENPSKPLKSTKIKLVNDYGDVIEETNTNEFGAFTFRNIPSDQNYTISMEDSDIKLPNNTKITLTNKSGKEIKSFYTGSGKFNFKVLASDKNMIKEMQADDENLIMDIFGYAYDENKKPISNAKFKLVDQDNKAEKQVTTSTNGKFNFRNLRADKNYIFEADETDPVFKGINKIYIADSKGRIYKVITKDGNGRFTFKVINADKAMMGEFVVDDPWLQVLEMKNKAKKEALTIVENIYYDLGSYKVDEAGLKVLDKVISILQSNENLAIELSSHTDSRASDDFNLKLSKKRADYAVKYMISKGINKKRLQSVGYGETRLLNKCANNIECSEEEHKINRRTEFKITESPTK
ncbi:MAG: SpaA isopeptide-forming pilin-related protein [Bacteroidia bacterium]